MQEADLVALPVLDTEERLVGVFRVDDAMLLVVDAHREDLRPHQVADAGAGGGGDHVGQVDDADQTPLVVGDGEHEHSRGRNPAQRTFASASAALMEDGSEGAVVRLPLGPALWLAQGCRRRSRPSRSRDSGARSTASILSDAARSS
jgi:hypothetical protein